MLRMVAVELSACLSLLHCVPAAHGQAVSSPNTGAAARAATITPESTDFKLDSGGETIPAGISSDDWSSIRAAYEAGRHAAFADGGEHRARNPGQQWTTHFDGRGFTTTPDKGAWTWGLELEAYGWGDAVPVATKSAAVTAHGELVSYVWDDLLTEWYVNDQRGLEHGYTVIARPDDASGALVLDLAIRGELLPVVSQDSRDVRFIDETGGAVLTYAGLTVVDAAGRSLAAGWKVAGERLHLSIDDQAARYPLTIDPLAQQAYLKASNTNSSDSFGSSVAIWGETVVVGAHGEDSASLGVNGDQGSNAAFNSGAAYVFVRNGTTWTQQAYLKASNTGEDDGFGWSVAISGDTVAVGARREDSAATGVDGDQNSNAAVNSGAAYVFVRNGTTWTQQAYLKASNTDAGDWFGHSVAVWGETVLVGALQESSAATGVNGDPFSNAAANSGAAYVFVRNGTTWTQEAYFKASNSEAGDAFGFSVGVWDNTMVVGAYAEDSAAWGVDGDQSSNASSQSGAAYIFFRSGTNWTQQAYLKASNTDGPDNFGISVGVSNDTAVVGAWREESDATGVNGDQSSNSALGSGAAYVFVRSGATWTQQAYLKASNTEAGDAFGWSVALSDDTVVVGAVSEDSASTGVNKDQSSNAAPDSGAAYVFARSGTTWAQQSYLKASNANASDSFGSSIAIWGHTVVVGASGEDSAALGVNGDQSSNAAIASGAAYVFAVTDWVSYCTSQTSSSGCVPTMSASGVPSLSAPGAFSVNGSNLEASVNGLMFFGTMGSSNMLFGGGILCVNPPLYRLIVKNTAGGASCTGTMSNTLLEMLAQPQGGPLLVVNQAVHMQTWFRDPSHPSTTGLSNGLEFAISP